MPSDSLIGRGLGAFVVTTGTTPAAGAEISQTVPAGEYWNLIGFRCTLVTSATAGNRVVTLTIQDETGTELMRFHGNQQQNNSLTRIYSFIAQDHVFTSSAGAAPGGFRIGLGQLPLLQPGWKLVTVTNTFKSDDQFSAPVMSYERTGRILDRD